MWVFQGEQLSWRFNFEIPSGVSQICLSYTAVRKRISKFQGQKRAQVCFLLTFHVHRSIAGLPASWGPHCGPLADVGYMFMQNDSQKKNRVKNQKNRVKSQKKNRVKNHRAVTPRWYYVGMTRITSAHISVARESSMATPNFKVSGKWSFPVLGGIRKQDGCQLQSISISQR